MSTSQRIKRSPIRLDQCSYSHYLNCDLCGNACLHPQDLERQQKHQEDCIRKCVRDIDKSVAVLQSKDKVSGICMDTVKEDNLVTRFGILEKCNHIFCYDCILRWRWAQNTGACPKCGIFGDFVVPSDYWVEGNDDKEKLIHDYKS